MAARLIQNYYEDWQKDPCYEFAHLHFNPGLTIFFENSVIKELILASTEEKIAVCSWKLREKMRWNVCRPRPLTQEVLETDYDVLSFTCNTKNHLMLEAAEAWHEGFKVSMKKILDFLGEVMPGEIKNPIYQNHFSAKLEIYTDYVVNWLSPAMDYMSKDKEMHALAMADSKYSELAKDSAAKKEDLMRKIGIDYYPMAPFLLERLFSIYCHNKRINVTYL